jgi:hypothetical protein
MIHIHNRPRTKAYRLPPAGYRAPTYHTTSKAIPVVMNAELSDMQAIRKQKEGK